MPHHITPFEEALDKLRKRVHEMGSAIIAQTETCFRVFSSAELVPIEELKKNEKRIDKFELKVDKICQRIFALQQPIANDLRFIMSALKLDNEMERIGDLAYEIAKRAESIREFPEFISQFEIDTFAEKVYKTVKSSVESLIFSDVEIAHELLRNESVIREEHRNIEDAIIQEMTKKSEVILVATNLILTLRHLERIAEHAFNIAESVIFQVDGIVMKHLKKKKENHQEKTSTDNETEA